jgi:hypothetical protein
MPTTRVTVNGRQFTLDARPDRTDLRDRVYQPPLRALPPQYPDPVFIARHLPTYEKSGLILDQQSEGACTGFGLAAVINYLRWKAAVDAAAAETAKLARVSARMLYHFARFYDEWEGEDYEGSSCRGAMKGWHRHGVCTADSWPYLDAGRPGEARAGWELEARHCTLGAYYRVDKDSIVDMQAAIADVGAIYCSAQVHDGWFADTWKTTADGIGLIERPPGKKPTGGHAFALVGYTAQGFIIQNSWGPGWGTKGFAILPYTDWVEHGSDAWVAVLGAFIEPPQNAPAFLAGTGPVTMKSLSSFQYANEAVRPWTERAAYEHTVVTGNNGIVLNRLEDSPDALAALQRVALDAPARWLADGRTKLVIYAHGGLNDEAASLARIRMMAPYFAANDVYPLFLTWKTGVQEALAYILADQARKLLPAGALIDPEKMKEALSEKTDRALEVACQHILVRGIWSQIKQNAAAARTEPRSTLSLLADHLKALQQRCPRLEIHLVGHSAGAILLGHLLETLRARGGPAVSTCALYAPACTVDFAAQHYVPAAEAGILKPARTTIDLLTDARELGDTVGPYRKSLLYLVSRALEDDHKTPLLGMRKAWGTSADLAEFGREDDGGRALRDRVSAFRERFAPGGVRAHGDPADGATAQSWDGQGYAPWSHGAFDNDVRVITATLERIREAPLRYPVENLRAS